MSTLQIIKLESGAFKHVDSIDGDFFLGRFSFKQELNKAFLVEAYGAKRREYTIEQIEVFDYLGTVETFTNFTDLENRLVELAYTGIDTNLIPFTLTDSNFGEFSKDLSTNDSIVDADIINYTDVSDTNKQKKTTWLNIKAKLKTYFDTLYQPIGGGGGGGSSSQYVRMNIPYFTDGTVNTWQSWNKLTNMLGSLPNNTLGTGSVPNATLVDSAFFVVYGATNLSKLILATDSSYSVKNYQIFIQTFNFTQSTGAGSETNIQTLINQTFTSAGANSYTFKDNFTIASHTLGAVTGVKVSIRYTGGAAGFRIELPQLLFKFD